ncbi:hypothetical protein [Kitasatospora sp. MMS16-BH015]|uniref:hypothetical protein n=1 Tax=Kitasatospora sp. MMS16-BH015 TaxID=2018025 RepID=UPI000CF1ECA0|nr:hypothetical protein [Kitasatospora sp. MMS16-BH015]
MSALLAAGLLAACGSGGGSTAAKGDQAAGGASPSVRAGATTGGAPTGAAPATGSGAPGTAPATAPGSTAAPIPGLAEKAPKELLLASATVMQQAGSAKLTMTGTSAEAGGTGAYSWKAPAAFELSLNTPEGPGKLLVTADQLYLGVDEETAAGFGGKHWLKLDTKSAGQGAPGGEDAGSLTAMLQTLNPAVQLTANALGGKLSKVGSEQVGGASTVHLRSELPVEALVAGMPGLSDQLKQLVTATLKKNRPSVTTDFWINGGGELVQQSSDNVGNGSKEPVTVGYTALGSAPQVTAPAAGDVMDFADMLK